MTLRNRFLVCATMVAACVLLAQRSGASPVPEERLVRIAELTIDADHLDGYRTALTEEISTSLRVEPGVLSLLAVAVKGHPNQIRILEIYRDEGAYQAHLLTPHFKKYKSATANMVKSLTLIETDPILLGTK
ncbi:putative quinol monooxygenase [Terriglobus sp. TAA 43]|uniref:putative quinol monooxygenase n=1 Tax=Terriglobus sp. TAA 43 TaxID=278961 RepID=UPI0006457087|nr:putative quinol monooxygenase [Terriglobus sp. TAA 43]